MNNKMDFSIDEITYLHDDIYGLKLIPDYNSVYFPPMHLRYMKVSSELLETNFLRWLSNNQKNDFQENEKIIYSGNGSVIQGGYYSVPIETIRNLNAFSKDTIINNENNLFNDNKIESPYKETEIAGENILESDLLKQLNVEKKHNENTYLYCFNVGQGDTSLLITAEKSAYIVDVNFSNENMLNNFVGQVQNNLNDHGINIKEIKGLIITHKHSDHIRGIDKLINSGAFDIEYFIINLDYVHATKCVYNMYISARSKISKWVNLNKECEIVEGNTHICFKNPSSITRLAADINDSSIVMCISHGSNLLYITGDASYSILENNMYCTSIHNNGMERMLKVSHHGSRTGTSEQLIRMLNPTEAFISAGYSKKYKHPHKECIDVLKNNVVNTIISKKIKATVQYKIDGKRITRTP